ncbi:MAG: YggT family protein [Clostridiales Family XIII bacterium]|jgi:YggT family protein|nr:YggT family protein [Clostridiales Family XIII bacterium]
MGLLIIIIRVVAEVLIAMLFIRSVLSWVVYSGNQYNRNSSIFTKIYDLFGVFTEPVVAPVRRFLSRFNTGPFDFAPLAAMILIIIVERILIRILLFIA